MTRPRRSKLLRPQLNQNVIDRPKLIERLDHALDYRLTLVVAPAGSGKTTALAAWALHVESSVVWLSLDSSEESLSSFVEHLAAAVQSVEPEIAFGVLSLLRLAEAPAPADLAAEFGDDLLAIARPLIIVLDDYHEITGPEIDAFVIALLRFPPPSLRLVIASRSDPSFPLDDWRVHGFLTEIRWPDLQFSEDETISLLAQTAGYHLPDKFGQALHLRTEGWIAGLRMVTMAIRNGRFAAAAGDIDATMQSFLTGAMLDSQPAAVQDFLLATSVPERICPDLCAAMVDGEIDTAAAAGMLEQIERAGLFIVPLGEDRRWYRYHPLFREALLGRVRETQGDERLRELHRRASHWFAASNRIELAVRHATQTGDPLLPVTLVEANAQRALAERRWPAIEHWLNLLSPAQISGRPDLLIVRAWVQQLKGQFEELAVTLDLLDAQIERMRPDAAPGDLARWMAEARFFRISFFTSFDPAAFAIRDAAEELIRASSWESSASASLALTVATVATETVGNADSTVSRLHAALAEVGDRTDTFAVFRSICACSGLLYIYLSAGEFDRCRQTAQYVLRLATAHDSSWARAISEAYLGTVAYERNDLGAAIKHFTTCLREPDVGSIVAKRAQFGLALSLQMSGRGDEAEAVIDRYLDRLFAIDAMDSIDVVRSFQARLALVRGDVEAAADWLRARTIADENGSVHVFEDPRMTRIRTLLAIGTNESLTSADVSLSAMLRQVAHIGARYRWVQLLALRAVVCARQSNFGAASDMIRTALEMARPAGMIRPFADLGKPMAEVLRFAIIDPIDKPIAERILMAIESGTTWPNGQDQRGQFREQLRARLLEVQHTFDLSNRETDVLELMALRKSNKEIAESLAISPFTVKRHATRLFQKLQVPGRRQAVRYTVRDGQSPLAPPWDDQASPQYRLPREGVETDSVTG